MNNQKPQNEKNNFTHQTNQPKTKKTHGDVWQDNGGTKSARSRLTQPAAVETYHRAEELSNKSNSIQKDANGNFLAVKTTSWMHPLVKAELVRRAELTGISLSRVIAVACEEWVHQDLHKQNETLLYPTLTQWLREELRKFGDRLIYFLMRIAIASEQGRILTTEVLKRTIVLHADVEKLIFLITEEITPSSVQKKEQNESPVETFKTIVDKSYNMARANVFRKSDTMKLLLEEWKKWNDKEKY